MALLKQTDLPDYLTRDFMLMVQSGRSSKTNRHQSPMLMMTVTMAFHRIALLQVKSVTFSRLLNPLCICPIAVNLSIYSALPIRG